MPDYTNIFYGIASEKAVNERINKWIDVAGQPNIFAESETNLKKLPSKLLEKYEVVSLDEALKRYPAAKIWVTYRKADKTAKAMAKKVNPENIYFLEADLEYRKGCRYLGKFISYRSNNFSPCCITGQAPTIKTSGTIKERFAQWQEYTTKLVDDVRRNRPNDCDKCHMLKGGFYRKSVQLNEINFGSNQPGDICNFRCVYCFCEHALKNQTNDQNALSTYEILSQISEMKEFDREDFTVQLANGEFCAYKQCDEILDILLKNKWKIILVSNCSIYKEKLATLIENGRVKKITTSIDSGTADTFFKVKQNNAFNRVLENLRKYPIEKTRLITKYIFIEGLNDNKTDIDGFYNIAKEFNSVIMLSSNLNAPYTKNMRELAARLVKRAKADGIKVDCSSAYLSPKDAEYINKMGGK
ncbi:MAG: radical SAM protein [Defluviitaleaceae bacterium]|nr:radical SAM protein [Defluviitaleaceae bacterium]